MPNWASTCYVMDAKPEQAKELYDKIDSLTKKEKPLVENGFGKLWMGCLVNLLGGDWNKRLPGCGNIVNRGIAGDDAIGIGHRLKQICPYKPKAIVLECGINDLSHALTPQQVAANIAEVMDSIMRQCPDTRLYVMGVFPINMDVKRWKSLDGKTNQVPQLNNLLRAKCKERGVTFINIYNKLRIPGTNKLRKDCCRDGLHLTEKGYKIWSEALKLWLKQC